MEPSAQYAFKHALRCLLCISGITVVILLPCALARASDATWTEQTSAGQRDWVSITSSADGTKLAAGVYSGYIYTSTNSGANWTEQTSAGSRVWRSIASSALTTAKTSTTKVLGSSVLNF